MTDIRRKTVEGLKVGDTFTLIRIFANQHQEVVLQASLFGLLPDPREREILGALPEDS
jgi:hypothetical protein